MFKPVSYYAKEGSLKFYLINCGNGLMHLFVLPDDTVILFDCNLLEDSAEKILNFMDKCIPLKTGETKKYIDIFINSHRDRDHIKGLKEINAKFEIKTIWDSGQTGANTDNIDYTYYMGLRRRLREKEKNNLYVPTPSNNPIYSKNGVDIYCLAAAADFQEDSENTVVMEAKIQHTNSMVLSMHYADRKILLTGDSDWKSWKEGIVPDFEQYQDIYENSEILIASHHGSRSFFTDEQLNETIDAEKNPDTTFIDSLRIINPDITLISCGDYSQYHHPNKEAVELYKEYSCNEQVYTTKEWGTFCGAINNDATYTVVPADFLPKQSIQNDKKIFIKCYKEDTGEEIKSGDNVPLNTKVKFKVLCVGNILNMKDKILVRWSVSNGGIKKYSSHQEIYKIDKKEPGDRMKYSNEVVYLGKHLLKCYIFNFDKHFMAKEIFVVNGVENGR